MRHMSDATLERERCSLHPERGAVGICGGCGRTVCLECAVPFRGSVRCERCAALELGDPEPVAARPRRLPRTDQVALIPLVAGLAATVPPWHRSGTLTSPLSAWSFTLDGWAALGCAALAAAAAATLLGLLRPGWGGSSRALAMTMSLLSVLAISVALGRAPEFFSSTPAPFLALTAAIAGALATAFSLVRRPRP